ncbi:uncharacterized protein [Dysidea avara]|uniref:uncharacterized protein isoform X1 n=1 Tax=Dysidea avara TaxID=196820 RepID=UPI00331C0F06
MVELYCRNHKNLYFSQYNQKPVTFHLQDDLAVLTDYTNHDCRGTCQSAMAILGAAMPSKEVARKSRKKENNRAYYEARTESILSERKDKYSSECRSQSHANEYYKNVTASREKSAEATKTSFNKDLAKSRIESAERQREYYHQDLENSED